MDCKDNFKPDPETIIEEIIAAHKAETIKPIETLDIEVNKKPTKMARNQELIGEAKKRGYTHDNFKCLNSITGLGNPNLNKWHYDETEDRLYTDSFGKGGQVVYNAGVWAEIIKPIETLDVEDDQKKPCQPPLIDRLTDEVISPARYNQYQIETIEMMRRIWGNDAVRLWAEMTAFKYRMRLGHKDETDLELAKEKWYLAYSKTIFQDESRN